jgi:hypothetical protein
MKTVPKYVKEMRAEFTWLKMVAEWHTDIYTSISFCFFISRLMEVYTGVSHSKKREILPQPPTVKNSQTFYKLRHKY